MRRLCPRRGRQPFTTPQVPTLSLRQAPLGPGSTLHIVPPKGYGFCRRRNWGSERLNNCTVGEQRTGNPSPDPSTAEAPDFSLSATTTRHIRCARAFALNGPQKGKRKRINVTMDLNPYDPPCYQKPSVIFFLNNIIFWRRSHGHCKQAFKGHFLKAIQMLV